MRQLAIALDDLVQVSAAVEPRRRQLCVQCQSRPFVILALIQVQDLRQGLVEILVVDFELVERDLVGRVLDQFLIVLYFFAQVLLETLVAGLVLGGDFPVAREADDLLGQDGLSTQPPRIMEL